MPRAKRTRTASHKAAAVQEAQTANDAATVAATAIDASSNRSRRGATTTSDDSEDMITRKTRNTTGKSTASLQTVTMSGALSVNEVQDEQGTRYKPTRGQERDTLTRLAREQAATSRAIETIRNSKQSPISTPRSKRLNTRQPTSTMPATLQVQQSQPETEAEADEDTAGEPQQAPPTNTRARNVPMAPMSVRKPMTTPRAEASMLALANFKRRSRAPSVLGIGNADETASISSDGSFGDLMPDDESTPLHRQAVQRHLDQQLASAQTPGGDSVEVTPKTNSSRKRKRGSGHDDSILVPFSQGSQRSTRSRSKNDHDQIEIASDNEAALEEPSSELPELSREETPTTPSAPSSTMAPPMSSSPVKPNDVIQNLLSSPASPIKGGKRAPKASEPGIANSWARVRGKKNATKVFDAITVKKWMPRRRQPVPSRDDFDVFGSEGSMPDPDADELSYAPSKRRAAGNRKARQPLVDTNAPAGRTKKGRKERGNKAGLSKTKAGAHTYSRRASGQENAVDSELSDVSGSDNDDVTEVNDTTAQRDALLNTSEELQNAVKKFANVDQWEMEFEDMGPSSSAMADAV